MFVSKHRKGEYDFSYDLFESVGNGKEEKVVNKMLNKFKVESRKDYGFNDVAFLLYKIFTKVDRFLLFSKHH